MLRISPLSKENAMAGDHEAMLQLLEEYCVSMLNLAAWML